MHSFRHTVASRALLASESVDEVAFLVGHRDATVTRVVYVHEIADGRRRQKRRSRMTAEFAGALRVVLKNQTDDGSSLALVSDGQQVRRLLGCRRANLARNPGEHAIVRS